MLRRVGGRTTPVPANAGDLSIDPVGRRVFRGDREVMLTARQFDVLEFLIRRAGQVLTKQENLNGVWQCNFDGDLNIVEVYIRRSARRSTIRSIVVPSKRVAEPATGWRRTATEYELTKLAAMPAAGSLTDDEFTTAKTRLLSDAARGVAPAPQRSHRGRWVFISAVVVLLGIGTPAAILLSASDSTSKAEDTQPTSGPWISSADSTRNLCDPGDSRVGCGGRSGVDGLRGRSPALLLIEQRSVMGLSSRGN